MKQTQTALLITLLSVIIVQSTWAGEGALSLTTTPREANIYVDGELKARKSPVVLKLPAGDHRVEVKKSGFATSEVKVFVPGDGVVAEKIDLQSEIEARAAEKGVDISPFEPDMVKIPAGSFRMGDLRGIGLDHERPEHTVTFDRSFYMGKYEVTFAEYDRFCEATERKKPDDEGWGRVDRPVIHVTWNDAVAYAEWLSDRTGKQYRLPTEAEWEYAARAGSETIFWWGDEAGENRANCRDCGSRLGNNQTTPVGTFSTNQLGLYDTVGNVSEWVQDCYVDHYIRRYDDGSAVTLGDCPTHVVRGGSWLLSVYLLGRSSSRGWVPPYYRSEGLGFRLARTH